MRILVTGSTGLIGSQVVRDLVNQDHETLSCYHDSKPEDGTLVHLDLLDHDSIIQTIKDTKPDSIIHLAAMTGVDQCETRKDTASQINCTSTGVLAKQAAKTGAFFLYVSTDYVFDGTKKLAKENTTPNPIDHYGQSKLQGELELNKLASPCAIARTSTPFGFHKTKKTFPLWVKENLETKTKIPVVVDQFTSPTYVPNLSKMLIEIATRQLVGVIHTAGATRISRYNLAEMIADKLNLDKKYLQPVSMNEIDWDAKRPTDSSLDVSWATELLHEKPQKIEQSLDLFLKECH